MTPKKQKIKLISVQYRKYCISFFFLFVQYSYLYDDCLIHIPPHFSPFSFFFRILLASNSSLENVTLLCCTAFAREHWEHVENVCRFVRPFNSLAFRQSLKNDKRSLIKVGKSRQPWAIFQFPFFLGK